MMNPRQEVFAFLTQAGVYHIATVDKDGKPHVRPFGSKQLFEDKIYVSCSIPKKVHEQLSGQKWFEISAMGEERAWVRLEGTAREVTDPAEKQRVYDDSQYGKSGGTISRAIEDVAFFELTEVSAWIFGKETREYQW